MAGLGAGWERRWDVVTAEAWVHKGGQNWPCHEATAHRLRCRFPPPPPPPAAGTQEFAAELRRDFAKVAWHRPKATRSESKEVFLLGLKRK